MTKFSTLETPPFPRGLDFDLDFPSLPFHFSVRLPFVNNPYAYSMLPLAAAMSLVAIFQRSSVRIDDLVSSM